VSRPHARQGLGCGSPRKALSLLHTYAFKLMIVVANVPAGEVEHALLHDGIGLKLGTSTKIRT